MLTKSDFYVTEFTEDMKAMTKAVDNSLLKGMKELYDADEIVIKDVFSLYDSLTTLLGLGNVSNRNMGTLLSYLRETAKAEDIHYSAGKPGLSVSFTLDTTNEENTIKIYLYEDGNRVGNSRSYFELYLDETGKSFKVRHAQFDGKIVELVKRNPNLISKYDYSSFEASEFTASISKKPSLQIRLLTFFLSSARRAAFTSAENRILPVLFSILFICFNISHLKASNSDF